jgi:hypothetical protein
MQRSVRGQPIFQLCENAEPILNGPSKEEEHILHLIGEQDSQLSIMLLIQVCWSCSYHEAGE